MNRTHGTLLRHLLELLDGAVGAAYAEAGLDYRPRYTPVVRALMATEPCTIGDIAEAAGITQPAATQTIALMIKEGIVFQTPSPTDGRQKMIRFTEHGRTLIPKLEMCWRVTAQAADTLDAELPYPLAETIESAIQALAEKSFDVRLREARAELLKPAKKR